MLRWTLLVMAFVWTQQSMASGGNYDLPTDLEIQEMATEDGFTMDMSAATDIAQIIDIKYGDKCENFAGDGEVNKWGKIIEKEFDKSRHQALYNGPSDVKALCNMYDELNDEDRKGLWILIISAMTHYESTCLVNRPARGPNGPLAGLLQLHRGKEARYSSGCRNGDGSTADRTLICGMSMLNDQIERGEPLFSRRSYWDVLRPQGESQKALAIRKVIGEYPACKTGRSTDGTVPLDVQPDKFEKRTKAPAKKSSKTPAPKKSASAAPKSAKKTRVATK